MSVSRFDVGSSAQKDVRSPDRSMASDSLSMGRDLEVDWLWPYAGK